MTQDGAAAAETLFASVPCLHGVVQAGLHGMGTCWCSDAPHAFASVLLCGDFVVCAGRCDRSSAGQLLRAALQAHQGDELILYGRQEWLAAAEQLLPGQLQYEQRWAFSPDHQQPDDRKLKAQLASMQLIQIPIGEQEAAWCRQQPWARDFVSCFPDDAAFAAQGCGVLMAAAGEIVAGASSYVSYPGGIEVQVQTRNGYEGRGYASAAAAALILAAHQRGLRVTWDAANAVSAHIAERLGFVFTGRYTVLTMKKSH